MSQAAAQLRAAPAGSADAVYARAGVLGFGRGLFAHGPMRGSETKYAKLRRIHTGQLVMSRLKAFEGAVAVAPSAFDGSLALGLKQARARLVKRCSLSEGMCFKGLSLVVGGARVRKLLGRGVLGFGSFSEGTASPTA